MNTKKSFNDWFEAVVNDVFQEIGTAIGGPMCKFNETGKAYKISCEVPGLSAKDLQVNVDDRGRVLHLTGAKASEENDDDGSNATTTKQETKFAKQISLPSDADTQHIDAKLANGLLNMTILKRSEQEKKQALRNIVIKE